MCYIIVLLSLLLSVLFIYLININIENILRMDIKWQLIYYKKATQKRKEIKKQRKKK